MLKKITSLLITCCLFFAYMVNMFAAELIDNINLKSAKYYEAVENSEKLRDAVLSVCFTATLTDGTEITYTTEDGWSNGANYEVSVYIKNEIDENYGTQQSLYIIIDGQEFWAGYTNVEVNPAKAIFRKIVTLNGATTQEKLSFFESIITIITEFLMKLYNLIQAIRIAT